MLQESEIPLQPCRSEKLVETAVPAVVPTVTVMDYMMAVPRFIFQLPLKIVQTLKRIYRWLFTTDEE
jgi:hypothetical protein